MIIGWLYIFVCEAPGVKNMKVSFATVLGIVIFIVPAVLAKWWLDFKKPAKPVSSEKRKNEKEK